ncbi:Gfo/Idh/MocA family protein [Solidesulfovibrio sp.]
MSLRVGIIGLGVGERHIAGYQTHPDCRVEALCDFSPQRLAAVGARHPGMRLTLDADDIVNDPAIDIVSIASWDDAHARQATQAVRQGKHVFVEKPLCLTVRELAAIRGAVAESPAVHLASNFVLRSCPRFQELKKRVSAGALGNIYYMEADYNYGRIHKITGGWRAGLDFYSVFLGGAVHMVDLLLWMTGKRVAEVSAMGNRIATAGTPFQHNDLAVALLRFDDDSVAKVAANFACVSPHFHRLALYGTTGTYENFPEEGRLTTSREPGAGWEPLRQAYPGAGKSAQVAWFVEQILHKNHAVLQRHQDSVFEATAVCLAVEQAMGLRDRITVHYD